MRQTRRGDPCGRPSSRNARCRFSDTGEDKPRPYAYSRGALGIPIIVLLLAVGACRESSPEAEQAAYEATKPWLAMMDAGEYEQSWEAAAPWFRDNIGSVDQWLAKARETRKPLGELRSRELQMTTFKTNPMGAPDGEYTIVVYDARWENGDILETVSMQRQADGSWLVVGYHVKQQR